VYALGYDSTETGTLHHDVRFCLATYFHDVRSNSLSFSIAVRPDHELLSLSCFRCQVIDNAFLVRRYFCYYGRIEEFERVTRLPFTMTLSKVVLQYMTSDTCDRKVCSTLRVVKVIVLDEITPRTSLMS
jgi:hypothetical protein